MFRKLRITPLLLAALALAGCGGSNGSGNPAGPGNTNLGQGSATITGSVNLSFTGVAALSVDASTSQYSIVLTPLRNGTPDLTTRVQFHGRGGRPAVGTYPVTDLLSGADANAPPNVISGTAVLSVGIFAANGGTLTITVSTSSRVEGTARFTALRFGVEQPITVEASFVALCNWTGAASC